MLARYSQEPFAEVQRQLYGPFVTAVKAHLVVRAFKDVYSFRSQMQIYQLLNTAFNNLKEQNFTIEHIALLTTSITK